MKTIVFLSGQARTFRRCWPTIRHHVLRHFPDPQFVVSTVRDADSPSFEEIRSSHPAAQVLIEEVQSQPELPIPVPPTLAGDWTVGRMYSFEPYAISVHPQAILRQLWQLERGWINFVANRDAFGVDLSTIYVRVRPDSWFRSFRPSPITSGKIGNGALLPWWGRFGGVNDRFAIMQSEAAEAYFTTYSQIPAHIANGVPLHTESLVKASLDAAGVDYAETLRTEFSKLNADGTFRDPEISAGDLADLYLRAR